MINVSVDGGGTKINVVVFDERHELLGFGHGGGVNRRYDTKENVCSNIANAMEKAMLNIKSKTIDNMYCAMVAGYDFFLETMSNLGYSIIRFVPMPEGYAYLLAGGLVQAGFVAMSGTGSSVVYCNGKDNYYRYGGYGIMIGDEGSGAWIGTRGINAALRCIIGWGVETTLVDRLYEYLDADRDVKDLLPYLYPHNVCTRTLFANFARVVGEEADKNDPVAMEIVREAGRLMALQTVAAVGNHAKDAESIGIYACGGAWKCSGLMYDSFKEHVYSAYPYARCHRGKFEPVLGGVIQSMIENDIEPDSSWLSGEYGMFEV